MGSTIDFSSRRRQHRSKLRGNKHCNRHLQRAFNKYGEDKFSMVIVETISTVGDLLPREQAWIDKYDREQLYNASLVAGATRGLNHTAETRAKMSAAQLERGARGENQYWLGKGMSDERKARVSEYHKGRKRSPAFSAANGKLHSKVVIQIDAETGESIKFWHSITQASKELGICRTSISQVCLGTRRVAGAFKWEYGLIKPD